MIPETKDGGQVGYKFTMATKDDITDMYFPIHFMAGRQAIMIWMERTKP